MREDHPLRCIGLNRVELVVTNLERSARFYEHVVGLTPLGSDARSCTFVAGLDGAHLVLRQGATVGCCLVAWGLEDQADVERLATRLKAMGMDFERITRPDGQPSLQLREPFSGAAIAFEGPSFEGGGGGQGRFVTTHARILRIGHVVFAMPRASDAIAWFCDIFDFRLSDWITGGTAFLRPAMSPYHHGLGIGQASTHCLHHVNFMVTEIDDLGRALYRLADEDVEIAFGPGRHPISGSLFLYFFDPDGITLEYSFGMETFPFTSPREPRAWPALPASVDTWGARRHPSYGRSGSIFHLDQGARDSPESCHPQPTTATDHIADS